MSAQRRYHCRDCDCISFEDEITENATCPVCDSTNFVLIQPKPEPRYTLAEVQAMGWTPPQEEEE